jgi:hypothetical protein
VCSTSRCAATRTSKEDTKGKESEKAGPSREWRSVEGREGGGMKEAEHRQQKKRRRVQKGRHEMADGMARPPPTTTVCRAVSLQQGKGARWLKPGMAWP